MQLLRLKAQGSGHRKAQAPGCPERDPYPVCSVHRKTNTSPTMELDWRSAKVIRIELLCRGPLSAYDLL